MHPPIDTTSIAFYRFGSDHTSVLFNKIQKTKYFPQKLLKIILIKFNSCIKYYLGDFTNLSLFLSVSLNIQAYQYTSLFINVHLYF